MPGATRRLHDPVLNHDPSPRGARGARRVTDGDGPRVSASITEAKLTKGEVWAAVGLHR